VEDDESEEEEETAIAAVPNRILLRK